MNLDPTAPDEGKTAAPKAGQKLLTRTQQNQVAVWIVEGFTYTQAQRLMLRDWGFFITKATWSYYRTARPDLIKAASGFVADQYLKTGYANRGVLFNKLARHAKRLEQAVEERGLFEADVHVIGFGRDSKTVASEKFDATLSRELRETYKQMEGILDKVDPLIKSNQQPTNLVLPDDLAARIRGAVAAIEPAKER